MYEVATSDVGRSLALKWYRPDSASASQLDRISRLLALGAPGRAFLWPIDIAHAENRPSFGYVMAARESRFESLSTLMDARVRIPLEVVCRAAANLADAFLALHASGLCYADISFGNLFVDPANGDVAICDNDNVGVDGERSDVLGTPYFMAPEIVRGEAVPSIVADRHSLAVVLFYLLLRHHPLFGAREHALHDLTPDSLRTLARRTSAVHLRPARPIQPSGLGGPTEPDHHLAGVAGLRARACSPPRSRRACVIPRRGG